MNNLMSSAFGYIWQNEFNQREKLLLVGFLLRVFVEYLIFLVILGDHHTIAKELFHTPDWYPATLYFELGFVSVLLLGMGLLLFLLSTGKKINPRGFLGRVAFILPIILVVAFYWLLNLPQLTVPALIVFVVVMVLFIVAYALEKLITINNLLAIIRTIPQFHSLIRLYFIAIASSLITASLLHKLTMMLFLPPPVHSHKFADMLHPATYQFMFIPLLILTIILLVVEQLLARAKSEYQVNEIATLWLSVQKNYQILLTRCGIGLLVGAFLVEWYFILPFFLQNVIGWDIHRISGVILFASLISLATNVLMVRFLAGFSLKPLFSGLLGIFAGVIVFVSCNLYHKHLVLLCVLLMALFYNSLQAIINKLIHYEILNGGVSIGFLLVGSEITIIVGGFMASAASVALASQLASLQQILVLPIVLSGFIVLSIVSYQKLSRKL